MAFSDPQSITIDGVAHSLARVSNGVNAGAFQTNDGMFRESVAHTYGKRTRRTIRLDFKAISPDPFNTSVNIPVGASFYLVADVPVNGVEVTDQKKMIDGFLAYLSASSGAAITRLLGGEN